MNTQGAPRSDAGGEAGAGGRFHQRAAGTLPHSPVYAKSHQLLRLRIPISLVDAMSGAGRVPGPRRGAQGAALQVEGVADHEDPALGARLQLLWLEACGLR